MHLQGARALVTGAANGIGLALARMLVSKGARVAVVDIDQAAGQKLAQELCDTSPASSTFYHCDVTNAGSLEETFKKVASDMQGLDFVCNNAGIADEENWERALSINLAAVIRGTYLGLDLMREKDWDGVNTRGVVVNVASMGGMLAMPFSPVYAATKHGVLGFSRSLGMLSSTEGLRVNCICPSFTETKLVMENMEASPMFDAVVRSQGPLLSPDLIAEGIVRLVEDDSLAGRVMRVTQALGIDIKKYADDLPAKGKL